MSISTALKARREALRNREDGFTLIELLVVVIIIGVLAAIAIPIYIGVQNNAKDSAAQSDLTNARTSAMASYTATGTWPTLNATTLANYGWTNTAGVTLTDDSSPGATSTAFCLKAVSASLNVFYLTQSGAPVKATSAPAGCA